ncbi:MAG: hypothetical protein M1358_03635 [Chloroflexi bacterium]|nr:hypothetical protein [Chloroflexota bacterium]
MPDPLSVVTAIITFLIGIASAVAAQWLSGRKARLLDKTKELKHLLNFPKGADLYLIYPPRQGSPDALLPRTATEDFMAINNLISALLLIEWKRSPVIRPDDQVPAELTMANNVIVFCSPRSNIVAQAIQEVLERRFEGHSPKPYFHYETPGSRGQRWQIGKEVGPIYLSPTYDAYAAFVEEQGENMGNGHESGHVVQPIYQRDLHDFAVITKVRNPWNSEKWIILIAGIRGIGSWGAEEGLKKGYDGICSRLKNERMGIDGSFSVVLEIHYRNSDIVATRVDNLVGLDDMDMPPEEEPLKIRQRASRAGSHVGYVV